MNIPLLVESGQTNGHPSNMATRSFVLARLAFDTMPIEAEQGIAGSWSTLTN